VSEGTVIGTQPWLPKPLSRSRWWTEPVPAERLAALRIGVGLVMLIDLFATYRFTDFYGLLGLTDHAAVDRWFSVNRLFEIGSSGRTPTSFFLFLAPMAWMLTSLGLVFGFCSRLCALGAWLIAIRVHNYNWPLHNGGDMIKIIILFYLMLSPCGAVWSLDAMRRDRDESIPKPILIPPWALRLLFIQLALTYCCNGLMKLMGPDWKDGSAMHWVMGDLALVRWSPNQLPLPDWLLRATTWAVMAWEISFPILVWNPRLRPWVLALGVLFHLSNLVLIEVGMFPLYMLCLYLPFLPGERLRKRGVVVSGE
jgi:uncharacterized membrane protein YphA (DoxX/SURF4 family)